MIVREALFATYSIAYCSSVITCDVYFGFFVSVVTYFTLFLPVFVIHDNADVWDAGARSIFMVLYATSTALVHVLLFRFEPIISSRLISRLDDNTTIYELGLYTLSVFILALAANVFWLLGLYTLPSAIPGSFFTAWIVGGIIASIVFIGLVLRANLFSVKRTPPATLRLSHDVHAPVLVGRTLTLFLICTAQCGWFLPLPVWGQFAAVAVMQTVPVLLYYESFKESTIQTFWRRIGLLTFLQLVFTAYVSIADPSLADMDLFLIIVLLIFSAIGKLVIFWKRTA